MQCHAMLITVFQFLWNTDEILKDGKLHKYFLLFIKKGKKKCQRIIDPSS